VQKAVLTFSQALPDQLEIRFTGEPDTNYAIEVSSNLVSWTFLFQTKSPDGIIFFRENTSLPRRFYRVRGP
jgi:hypothetical protein